MAPTIEDVQKQNEDLQAQLAEIKAQLQATKRASLVDKLKAGHFLRRFDSGVLYGIAGVTMTGVSVALGFMPTSIGSLATGLGVGTALFIAEWVRGIAGD